MLHLETLQKNFAPKANDLNVEYHAHDPQRTFMNRLASALGVSDTEIARRIEANTDDAGLVKSLYDELDAIVKNPDTDPNQKMLAQDLLVDFNPGEGKLPLAGAEQLRQIADSFGKDSEVPKNAGEYAGKLVSAYTEYAAKVLSDAIGVTNRPWAQQLFGALKAVQSGLLLNLNVGYVVPHLILNPMTILATGPGGFVGKSKALLQVAFAPDVIREFWKKWGYDPYRSHAGSGMGGTPEVDVLGRKETLQAERNLRKETAGKGFMAGAERIAQKFGKSFAAMPKVAESMEQHQSMAAMYIYTKKTFDALIRHGRNYTPLETNLRSQLDAFDPTIVGRIDNAIRNNMDADSVMKEVFGDELRVDLAGALDELSVKLNTDARIISETLDAYPGLKERLADIRRIEDVDPLFSEIYQKMQDTFAERLGREVGVKVKEIMTRVGASGVGEALRIVDQNISRSEENYLRHQQIMMEAHAEADTIKDPAARNAFWNAKRAESARFFAQAEAIDYAILRGMFEGMNISKIGSQKYMADVISQYKSWQKHYRLIGDTWNNYYRNMDSYKTPEEKSLALSEAYAKINEDYTKTFEEVAGRQTVMDTDFVEMVRLKYGDDTAASAKKWRDSINTYTQDRGRLISAEREKIQKMTDIEKVRAEWKRFYEEELAPLVREYHNLDHAGVAEMNDVMTGMRVPEKPAKGEAPKEAEVKPAEEVAPEVVRAEFEIADDANYMLQALEYIDQPGKSGVVIPDGEGGFTRLASGSPDWYSRYFGDKKSMDYISCTRVSR